MVDLINRKLTSQLKQSYRVAALCVAMGMTSEQTEAHSHLEPSQLAQYRRDPRFQLILEEFNQQIEKTAIERTVRRQFRVQAKAQLVAEEALEHYIDIMRTSDNDAVRSRVIEGILRQIGVDMNKVQLGEGIDAEAAIKKSDPSFFKRHEETMKELEAINAPS